MAARKLPRDGEPNPISVRLSSEVLDGLDTWLTELNRGKVSPLARTDLIRGVLAWAIKARPEWEEGKFLLELQDGNGNVIATRGVRTGPGSPVDFSFDDGNTVAGYLQTTRFDGERVIMTYSTEQPHRPVRIQGASPPQRQTASQHVVVDMNPPVRIDPPSPSVAHRRGK